MSVILQCAQDLAVETEEVPIDENVVSARGICNPLCVEVATVPERLSAESLEAAFLGAGFAIEDLDLVGSEWYEANQEAGRSPNYMLQISRLRRAKEELLEELGEPAYRSMHANALWGAYILIGKLETRLYVLRNARS